MILTIFEAELGYSQNIELVTYVLLFQCHKFRLNRSSITPDIVKNLRRDQAVTVQKRDSNSWTVTVKVFVNERF